MWLFWIFILAMASPFIVYIVTLIYGLVWSNKQLKKNNNNLKVSTNEYMNDIVYVDDNGKWFCPRCDYINNDGKICKSCGYEIRKTQNDMSETSSLNYSPLTYDELHSKEQSADAKVVNDIIKYLKLDLPNKLYLDKNDCEEFHFTLSSRSEEMQDNLLDIEVGQELEIEKDVETKKIIFTVDGYEIGYAPPKYEDLIYGLRFYYAEVEKVTQTESGNISVKVLFRYD